MAELQRKPSQTAARPAPEPGLVVLPQTKYLPVPTSPPAAIERSPAMPDNDIMVEFIDPSDSAHTLNVAVSPESTPHWLIDQLVKNGFIPPADKVGQYKLCNADTGVQLLDNVALGAAGVANGTTLNINDTMTGAGA